MNYGGNVPSITPSYSGFVNGQGPSNLTTQPTCGTTATSSSSAGSYTSSCAGAADNNYTITYVNGTVTVNHTGSSVAVTSNSNPSTYDGG